MVKNLPAMQETCVQSLGREDLLEKGMATHSRIFAWRQPSRIFNLELPNCPWAAIDMTGTRRVTISQFAQDCPNLGHPWWLRQQTICLQCRRPVFDPWIWKIVWSSEQLPTPVFLPGEFHRQRSLTGYS